MSIALSIKVQDGIILASDSCVVHRGMSYFSAEKIIQPIRGLPLAAVVVGEASLGLTSVLDHLRAYGTLAKARSGPWRLSKHFYTMGGLVSDIHRYLQGVLSNQDNTGITSITFVGYSAQRPLPETWRLVIDGPVVELPELIWGEPYYGLTWDGERECLDRLLMGVSPGFQDSVKACGLSDVSAAKLFHQLQTDCGVDVVTPGMPLQDAVELANFLVNTTISFVRFAQSGQVKTVGGPIDIATITRHDGFRWVQRKRPHLTVVKGETSAAPFAFPFALHLLAASPFVAGCSSLVDMLAI